MDLEKKIIKTNSCRSCKTLCSDNAKYVSKIEHGLSEQTVLQISKEKNEPIWMQEYRLAALNFFKNKKMQTWGPDLENLNFDDLCFYLKAWNKSEDNWQNLPQDIKKSFEQENLQKIEEESLGGLGAQYESEIIYHNLKEEWESLGVIFCPPDLALQKYPDIFKEYFGTVVDFNDNKFAALNGAVWSGGSFIYIPPNVHVKVPLQAYYKMHSEKLGQFERTLIIADENSSVSYIEGCSAKSYSDSSLHSAVVEIIAKKNAKVKYYTIQNWSKNVYNLVTKRAIAYQNASVEWIDCNVGSQVTMKYPSVILKEKGAKTAVWSFSVASDKNQIQDTGAKIIHLAPNTSSKIVSKSLSSNGGRASYRGLIKISKNAQNSKSFVQCDGLILDNKSRSDAYPVIDIANNNVDVGHEARVNKIVDEQIFYLMSRGLSNQDAQTLIIHGFIEPIVKELPAEYALEIDRLIQAGIGGCDAK
ncbi:Fe-S cluster assembly protein SufB [Candidatus Babeliales bacterium]|nr:Fe-S cluster assembly protein SufB [Candidatus Babeliales bacterium]